MFRTLYSKLAATLLVLFLLLGAMFYVLLRASFQLQEEAVTQQLHEGLASRIAREWAFTADGKLAIERLDRELFSSVMRVNPSVEAYRLGMDGNVVAHAAPPGRIKLERVALSPVLEFVRGGARYPLRGDDPRNPGRRVVFSAALLGEASAPLGYLYLVLTSEERASVVRSWRGGAMLQQAGWVMAGGLVCALFAGFVMFNMLTQRLRQLSSAIHAFRGGGFRELSSYVPTGRPGAADEIDQLGAAYNEMAERIVHQLRELTLVDMTRRDLIANVSHDLRTPLASLRGYLDTLILKYDSVTEQERRYYLETAARQSERLGKLVADLFDLAKLDAHDVEPHFEPFSASELVHDVVQGARLAAAEREVNLIADVQPGLPFAYGDIGLIERVLQNLIDNGVRHTPRGGRVSVGVAAEAGRVQISVSDNGQGIPPDVLSQIFDRFFTLDKSRTIGTGGTGLGLAIAKRIVELHGSTLTVDSIVGVGSSFTFTIGATPGREHEPVAEAVRNDGAETVRT